MSQGTEGQNVQGIDLRRLAVRSNLVVQQTLGSNYLEILTCEVSPFRCQKIAIQDICLSHSTICDFIMLYNFRYAPPVGVIGP